MGTIPLGDVLKLCNERRGEFKSQIIVGETRQMIAFEIPLAEIIYDFYDKLKAMTSGYGTKCYGGDVSRKRKLLDKQREGKKKMKSVGRVDIPQEAFMAVLDQGED